MKRSQSLNLRKEKSKQYSGYIDCSQIKVLKRKNFIIKDIALDGDAPKQYIKAYFFEKKFRKTNFSNWHHFFAKFGGKSYPHESVIEYSINKIGEYLGLNMNEVKLVIINEQIRFLSKDFIKKGKKLIHGIEILSEYFEDKMFVEEINDDKKSRREYFTFDEIEKAIYHVFPKEADNIMIDLVRLLTFDAILGNNDRHFYNWGVIGNIFKKNSGIKFAPIYDSARGLFWSKTEQNINRMYNFFLSDKSEINSYIKKSKPRISIEGNPDCNHFELIEYLIRYSNEYKNQISKLLTNEIEMYVFKKMDIDLKRFFSFERYYLMKSVIQMRFNYLRKLLK